VELSDGLSFAELMAEVSSRLPRDATLVCLLAAVPLATAVALGNFQRQGYAVTVVLVLIAEDEFEQAYGRLMAEGIRDIRHLRAEADLPSLCQKQVQRTAPYQMAIEY
jgi:hypothetical protein